MSRYSIYGKVEEAKRDGFSSLTVHKLNVVELSDGRDEGSEDEVQVVDDDVVAVTLEDGFSLWIRGDDLRREFGDNARDGALTLKPGLATDDAERGIGAWLLKGLRIFGIDPVERLVEKTALAVERDNGDRLLRLDPQAPQPWRVDAWQDIDGQLRLPAEGKALLLFIHGTFSSTLGSFGELFKAPGPVETLEVSYPEGIYGFEHPTLTKSPIANALALIDRLPANACLHLVSHSRGGLVGDLLCLAPLIEQPGWLSTEDLKRFPPDDQRDLPLLVERLREKRPRVERFVRVASPSRGTTLASGRVDRWLSVVFHLLSKVPLLSGPIADAMMEFVMAAVKEPKDAETLPGLAAMMPSSQLVGLLNRPGMAIPEPAELAVIAGDIEAAGLWERLKLLLPDLFFAGDHDLVVNTGSMYGGLARSQGWYCFDQGSNVNHFNYFGFEPDDDPSDSVRRQPITVDALLYGLRGALPGRLYQPLAEAPTVAPARSAGGVSGRRPILFVLPGMMGSSLAVRDPSETIWLSIRRLAIGQIERLRIDQELPVKPTGLLDLAYGDLLAFLAGSHDVVPFPYDWRHSVRVAARLLADEVALALDRAESGNQPVRILAHSMGGLVARAMIAERPDLWRRIRARDGRLVMLGTPNRGSWEIVRLLVAQAATLKQLALLDLTNDHHEVLDVIREFPGILELLPDDPRDFFSNQIWQRLNAHDADGGWGLPGQGKPGAGGTNWLRQAREVRAWLDDKAIDPEGMIYVAGQAPETASGVDETVERRWLLPDRKRLRFIVSARGDSSVLWDRGLLPDVPTWYAPGIGHGDLANDRTLFVAIEDLLEQGRSDARSLSRDAPVTRAADVRREMVAREPAYYPDERALVRSVLGISPTGAHAAVQKPIGVSVTHGNLAFARHRVAVGHYDGDTIIAAEAYLDHVLSGRLSARHAVGLYPGAIGSHALFDHPSPHGKPPGALVVGLGEVGVLTPSLLAASFTRALLELARREDERPASGGLTRDVLPRQIALSSLLIGTGAGGIAVQDSVLALLRGLAQANRTLEQAGQADCVRFCAIELIELWQDRAIGATRALDQIEQDPELVGLFGVEPLLKQGRGGNRGVRPGDDDRDWWHRLQIRYEEGGTLRYTLLTQRARAEETLDPTQTELVDRFVARASASTGSDADLSRTLFEMLLPNRLKDGSGLRTNLVLVLDEKAARFPWEMLEDRWSQSLPGLGATTRAGRSGARRPGAVEFGMVRQLATGTFREQPVMAARGHALVIGDPQSDFVPLPGARDEAKRVAAHLKQMGVNVRARIEPQVEEVVIALHADAYQILHLAGHGVHRHRLDDDGGQLCDACGQPLRAKDRDLVSGMIIGKGMVLTPADVRKMRRVPELVFLNCCHLGRPDGDRTKESDRDRMHRLAANLAVQFIRMGVRAVIAAGWAVSDGAALTFAESFYRRMAAGYPFGTAVRQAREQTWQQHPGINTWGAYQCYGDPDFRLDAGGKKVRQYDASRYVCAAEVIADLNNLRAEALTASVDHMENLGRRLGWIEKALQTIKSQRAVDWCARGDVAEALGLAQGELGRFEDAVKQLDHAVRAEDAGASWNAIEQRARYQARYAKQLHFSGKDDGPEAARKLFDEALKSLSALQLDTNGPLPIERYRSLSGIHWRRVQILPAEERAAELDQMISVFEQAAKALGHADSDRLDPYSRLLWLSAKLMKTAYRPKRLDELCPNFSGWCSEVERRAQEYEQHVPGASADAIRRELQLLRLVEQGALNSASADQIIAELRDELRRGASQRQLASILDYVELLQVLAEGATQKPKTFHHQAVPLARIGAALKDWRSVGEPVGGRV